ncbi:hypothetical protein SAMN05192541_1784 [Bradyrhizobium arachidis]|uniref:Uncharacterized protein n=1 Tax=Bradyrhizobium arachidis TaxID=858423 RepID=A0AAE7NX89_9BRAD|nr:hypothetical protein WN72_36040 [Bradyrhizobium arachidis]SFV19932.1 hypothetical protein SAMN05192541_1784 [Bradyrhizobium arachidis]
MLQQRFTVYRPENLEADIAHLWTRYRDIVVRSVELLSRPPPDTFLGRKHHDLIPLPYQTEE